MAKRAKMRKTAPEPKKISGLEALAALQNLRGDEDDDDFWDGPIPDSPGKIRGPELTQEQRDEMVKRLLRGPAAELRRLARLGPRGDPADNKTARYALRLHPDLLHEATELARSRGQKLSQLIERALIEVVNDAQKRPILDPIGRYNDPLKKR